MNASVNEGGWTVKQLMLVACEWVVVCVRVFTSLLAACVGSVWPRRNKSIVDDVVLVTGAGSGIGRLLAVQLAKHKPRQLILWGRHEATLRATAQAVLFHNVPCTVMVCDVANRNQVSQKALEVKEKIGDVTILINNAGVVYGNTILDSKARDIQHTLEVNTLAHFWTIRAFLPSMVESNYGHIVTINSLLGHMGLANVADYCASKFALTGLTEALHLEMVNAGKTGVHVTSVHPYIVNTDMFTGCETRFPWLFPALDKEYVAKKTVDAILTDRHHLILPWYMAALLVIKSVLPVTTMQIIQKFFGADRAMETIHRHQKPS